MRPQVLGPPVADSVISRGTQPGDKLQNVAFSIFCLAGTGRWVKEIFGSYQENLLPSASPDSLADTPGGYTRSVLSGHSRGFILLWQRNHLRRSWITHGGKVSFFDVKRTRAWIMLRRIAHTSHHRGKQGVANSRRGRLILANNVYICCI